MNERKILKIKFVHVDTDNRPIFKVVDLKSCYLCDTACRPFYKSTTEQQIKDFYKDMDLKDYLVYYGTTPDKEDPEGGNLIADLLLI